MAETFEGFLKKIVGETEKLYKLRSFNWYRAQVKKIVETGIPHSPKGSISTKDLEAMAKESFKLAVQKTSIFPTQTIKKRSIGIQDTMSWNAIGQMMMYVYDPKGKKTLPYYDKFPLMFMVKSDGQHTLGLNLHYLPPYERAKLMGALYTLINNKDMDEKTRLNITYQTLKGASKFRLFKPCLKSYLSDHIRSRIYIIDPNEWNNVLLLPIANFQKEKEFKVWQDSLKSLKK